MKTTRKLLRERGMGDHWYDPTRCTEMPKEQWKDEAYRQVERWHDTERASRMSELPSAQAYLGMKHWGEMDAERAAFKGEIGQRGALVFEKYLDDTGERLGSRLKLMCRGRCLPTLQRVSREAGAGGFGSLCLMCESGKPDCRTHHAQVPSIRCATNEAHGQNGSGV